MSSTPATAAVSAARGRVGTGARRPATAITPNRPSDDPRAASSGQSPASVSVCPSRTKKSAKPTPASPPYRTPGRGSPPRSPASPAGPDASTTARTLATRPVVAAPPGRSPSASAAINGSPRGDDRGQRRDEAHRADRERVEEQREPAAAPDPRRGAPQHRPAVRRGWNHRENGHEGEGAHDLGRHGHRERALTARRQPSEEIGRPDTTADASASATLTGAARRRSAARGPRCFDSIETCFPGSRLESRPDRVRRLREDGPRHLPAVEDRSRR